MTLQIPRPIVICALATLVFYGVLGTEIQCTPAEARPSLDSLQAQIDELSADADSELVLVDGTGRLVGPTTPTSVNATVFLVDAVVTWDGLTVVVSSIDAEGPGNGFGNLFFAENYCTGSAYMVTAVFQMMGPWFIPDTDLGIRVHVADPSGTEQFLTTNSRLDSAGGCVNRVDTAYFLDAVPLFVWEDEFSPPYSVITRGELAAP